MNTDIKLLFAETIAFVADSFKTNLDLGGNPYFLHCYRVAEPFIKSGDYTKAIIALLHDMVEDKKTTLDELRDKAYPEYVLRVVDLLTHDKKKLTYEQYIDRIASCPIACEIKISDLTDNSDFKRMRETLDDKGIERLIKYNKAYVKLRDVIRCTSN